MSRQHGVASSAQARRLGISRRVELRLLASGALRSPCPGIVMTGGVPLTFHRRAMAAALGRGVVAVSHGAAARLHALDGFTGHETVDVLGVRGANPRQHLGVQVHRSRADLDGHTTTVDGIPVLTVGATLALLAPAAGIAATARALDSALRAGATLDELTAVAAAWRRRGRAGPAALLVLLGERADTTLPRRGDGEWRGLVGESPVRDRRGVVLARLDLSRSGSSPS